MEGCKPKIGEQTQSNLPPATSTPPPRIPIKLESFHQINLETYIITISIKISIKIIKQIKLEDSLSSPSPSKYPSRSMWQQITLETYIITISIKISIKIKEASNQPGGLKYHHHLHQNFHQYQGGNLTELSLRTAISSERRPRLLELLLSIS